MMRELCACGRACSTHEQIWSVFPNYVSWEFMRTQHDREFINTVPECGPVISHSITRPSVSIHADQAARSSKSCAYVPLYLMNELVYAG